GAGRHPLGERRRTRETARRRRDEGARRGQTAAAHRLGRDAGDV
ncbi:MAG: hypothetical protein AVDCRST_MAG37-3083, partial [uncultured Rubrobacteraceae bacterium]